LARKKLLDRKRDLTGQLRKVQNGPEAQRKKVQSQMDDLNEQLGEVDAQMASGEMWRVTCDCDESLILAGEVLFAGGEGEVTAFDAASGQRLWTGQIDGTARGLAAADGRLFVSSDTGAIYCFAPEGLKNLGVVRQPVDPSPYPAGELSAVCQAAAEQIVRDTGIDRGYCLVLGAGTGRLALELAKRTDLQICAVESDRGKAEAARKALNAAGVYGARVLVEHCDLSQVPFSDYFANLIVSEQALVTGQMPAGAREAFRMLKPLGGTICIGQPAAARGAVPPLQKAAMRQWAADAGIEEGTFSDDEGLWLNFRRGALPGAGSWTHQYANPGNTTCSDDQLVRCPLGTLWFGNPGPGQMAERHRRAAAPLAVNGRMFVLGEGQANRIGVGENTIRAYDAYNGLKLWERSIRGALRVSVTHDSGNSAANEDSLFVAVGDQCLQFDAATGQTVRAYEVPGAADDGPCKWGYVAVVGQTLYGSRTLHGRTAECIFAYDLDSGALRWKHETAGIGPGSIAIGDGRLFFAASSVNEEQREAALANEVKEMHRMSEAQRAALLKRLESAAVYRVVTLDAATGNLLWEKPVEVTGASGGAYWCSLGSIYQDDVLVLFGVFLDGHYWTQFLSGQFEQRQVVALSGTDGSTLWRDKIGYRVRPIVVGDTLHAEPWAFDLHTGRQRTRIHPVTGREEVWQFARPGHHCGCPAASPHTLLFRSYNLGWYDLDNDYGTQHFGGQRPGCWINFVPANGLLLMPEASSGCMCPFPNTCTVVFQSRQENRQWAYFSQPGPMTPVKRLAITLGAPGDRKDSAGLLWLGYPRPRGSLVLQFDVGITQSPGGEYFTHDPARLPIDATDSPWVFQSGVRGLQKCVLPVAGPADGTARYTVRLAFAELEHNSAGQRVFDIKIQGQLVAEDFDIFLEAGGKNRAIVREFPGIKATEAVTIELIPKAANPTLDQLPILQGIDLQREKVLTLGLAAPQFLLNDAEPSQTRDLVLVNNKESGFTGTLHINAPDGFALTPTQSRIDLPAGQRVTVPLTAVVDTKGPADDYPVEITLTGDDGQIELRVDTELEYLGNVERMTVKAVEDTHAQQKSPATNYGTAAALNVDGGDREMGDHHHSIGYMKFPFHVKGKLVSAALRIYNAGNPTGNSGQVRLVTEPWDEKSVTYDARPKLGTILAQIGAVTENETLVIPLRLPDDFALHGDVEVSLAIGPTGCDGVNYISREGGKPAELIIETSE
jgi:outer membrane protein assembly factor BamB